jgi:signal transduction histidine kinase
MSKTSWSPEETRDPSAAPESAARPLDNLDERIFVLAPFANDTPVIEGVLQQAQLQTERAENLQDLSDGVRAGAGAVLVTQEALTPDGLEQLACLLREQPTWSDLPVFLLLSQGDLGRADAVPYWRRLSSSPSVTVLRRPIPSVTLLTALQSALRARRRQYEVRDLIAREQSAREQAEAANRVKDEFLASVSHELRTPLSAILIWGKLMAAGRLNPEQTQQAIGAIVSGAEAQSRLIEDLLDVTRMLTGKLRLDIDVYPLAPIVLAAAELVRPSAEAKRVRLDLLLDPSPTVVLGDPHRLEQVFWNVLSNAIKFSEPGGSVQLEVTHDSGWLEVKVTDAGAGIEPSFLPRVFERFWQSPEQAPALPTAGLGLGLSIARQLVELHGGTITAASAGRGRGSTFVVRLPLTKMTDALTDPVMQRS